MTNATDIGQDSAPVSQHKPAEEERARSKKIGSLQSLWPFIAPYRVLLFAALGALVLTACVSLTLPLAVRRVVDWFQMGSSELLYKYFVAAIGIAGLLAIGTGMRYYLVTRLG